MSLKDDEVITKVIIRDVYRCIKYCDIKELIETDDEFIIVSDEKHKYVHKKTDVRSIEKVTWRWCDD